MTALEYRNQAIKWLESGDENLAKTVYAFIKAYKDDGEGDWWSVISDQEKEFIQASLQQLDAGKGISNSEVRKDIDVFLKKA